MGAGVETNGRILRVLAVGTWHDLDAYEVQSVGRGAGGVGAVVTLNDGTLLAVECATLEEVSSAWNDARVAGSPAVPPPPDPGFPSG